MTWCRGGRSTPSPRARRATSTCSWARTSTRATLYGPEFLALAPGVAEGRLRVDRSDRARRVPPRAVRAGRDDAPRDRHDVPHPGDPARAGGTATQPAHVHVSVRVRVAAPDGRLGAVHGADLPFMWNRTDETADAIFEAAGTERSPALVAAMHGAWVAFVRTGVPQHPGLPEWPAYDPARRATMRLDDECRVADDPAAEQRTCGRASGTEAAHRATPGPDLHDAARRHDGAAGRDRTSPRRAAGRGPRRRRSRGSLREEARDTAQARGLDLVSRDPDARPAGALPARPVEGHRAGDGDRRRCPAARRPRHRPGPSCPRRGRW